MHHSAFRRHLKRRASPRFQGEAFSKDLDLVKAIEAMAQDKGCTPAKLALAWVLAQGSDIVPIPGTRRRRYLEENLGALDVALTGDDRARIDRIMPSGAATGTRCAAPQMASLGR